MYNPSVEKQFKCIYKNGFLDCDFLMEYEVNSVKTEYTLTNKLDNSVEIGGLESDEICTGNRNDSLVDYLTCDSFVLTKNFSRLGDYELAVSIENQVGVEEFSNFFRVGQEISSSVCSFDFNCEEGITDSCVKSIEPDQESITLAFNFSIKTGSKIEVIDIENGQKLAERPFPDSSIDGWNFRFDKEFQPGEFSIEGE